MTSRTSRADVRANANVGGGTRADGPLAPNGTDFVSVSFPNGLALVVSPKIALWIDGSDWMREVLPGLA
jgi:hypothetical protein